MSLPGSAMERRVLLTRFLRREYGTDFFNADEASFATTVKPLRRLYPGPSARLCGRDLGQLRGLGVVERVGSQWRLLDDRNIP